MRIIGGIYKSRRLNPPTNLPVRPTTDSAKESLFNILNNYFSFEEVAFLDLFSGTGNIAYEMSSRGSTDIECVEQDFKCVGFIKSTVEALEMHGVNVIRGDVFKYLEETHKKFDIIFADAPYMDTNTHLVHELVFDRQLLNSGGFLILEHGKDKNFSNLSNLKEARKVGNVNFTIFK